MPLCIDSRWVRWLSFDMFVDLGHASKVHCSEIFISQISLKNQTLRNFLLATSSWIVGYNFTLNYQILHLKSPYTISPLAPLWEFIFKYCDESMKLLIQDFSDDDLTTPESPDDMLLKDVNPCLTPCYSKMKSKVYISICTIQFEMGWTLKYFVQKVNGSSFLLWYHRNMG